MFFNASHLHPDFGYGRLLEESVKNVMERVRNTDLLSVCDNDIISSLKVEVAKRLDSVNYDKYCDNVLLCSGGILYVESPSHILSTSIMNSVGLNIVPIPMDSEGLSITELKRKYKKNKNAALFLSSRGNIVNNICLSHNRAKEILEFADNINMPVIEMDYNSIYYPNGAVLKKLDTNNRVIYLSNIFASYTFGFDLCWIITPDIIYGKIRDNLSQYFPYQISLELYIFEDMFRNGSYYNLMKEITPKLKEYKEYIDSKVNEHLSDCIMHSMA